MNRCASLCKTQAMMSKNYCPYWVSEPLLSCFCRATQFLWDMLEIFAQPFPMYGIKCLGEIYKQMCHLKIFCMHSFNVLTNSQNL